ncbi:TetR/AcrR family transcriptional regulator [Streptosporangium sp. NPDC050855]|uniref:TetR/AcrR family transcriptional regulator n=1 Tax=Streptosporangium sp. NPDC050855 TaxID=3366194 RepID=UPI0037B35702
MSAKKASDADPARSLALLWGSHSKPGRSGLTVRSIVLAAVELANAEGLDAVSMRHVAERLEVGTMSLYTHVPGKGELVDLMIDATYGELYADVDAPSRQPGGWRGALEFIAARNWDLYRRNPWMLQARDPRSTLGPNATLKYEAELRPLEGWGLSDVEMDSVLSLVLSHVESTARSRADQLRVQQESGMDDAEWWLSNAPLLERLVDAGRFPVASRVGQAAGEAHQAITDPAHALSFGLERILDGVAVLIEGRGRP